MTTRSKLALRFILVFSSVSTFAADIPLKNWSVPATWSRSASGPDGSISSMAERTQAMPYIALDPCRIADTRGFGFSGAYGPPALPPSGERTFILYGRCSIPNSAQAVSLNITVAEMASSGNLKVWPGGSIPPSVSTVNWTANTFVIANAAIVPISSAGTITVKNESTTETQLIMDVNGYFYAYGEGDLTPGNWFGIQGTAGDSLIFGWNKSNSPGVSSVGGHYSGTGNEAAGVHGRSVGGSGVTAGGKFTNNSTTDLASGAWGREFSFSGVVFGVKGESWSVTPGAAGVVGTAGTGVWTSTISAIAGVRGNAKGGTVSIGVVGEGADRGVHGARRNATTGAVESSGVLGFSTTSGVHAFGEITATGTKSFVEPHPTRAGYVIKYVALEGPEAGTYFRGRGKFSGGRSKLPVPDHFRMASSESGLSIQVTPIGDFANFAVVSLSLDEIVLKGSRDVEFYYHVSGVRRAAPEWQPIQIDNVVFAPLAPDDRLANVYGEENRRRLVENGTFNADGSVNMETAERMGWAAEWRERAEAAEREAARAGAAASASQSIPQP